MMGCRDDLGQRAVILPHYALVTLRGVGLFFLYFLRLKFYQDGGLDVVSDAFTRIQQSDELGLNLTSFEKLRLLDDSFQGTKQMKLTEEMSHIFRFEDHQFSPSIIDFVEAKTHTRQTSASNIITLKKYLPGQYSKKLFMDFMYKVFSDCSDEETKALKDDPEWAYTSVLFNLNDSIFSDDDEEHPQRYYPISEMADWVTQLLQLGIHDNLPVMFDDGKSAWYRFVTSIKPVSDEMVYMTTETYKSYAQDRSVPYTLKDFKQDLARLSDKQLTLDVHDVYTDAGSIKTVCSIRDPIRIVLTNHHKDLI